MTGNEGSQEAGVTLKDKAHIVLSYLIDAKGHSTEEIWIVSRDPQYSYAGNYPPSLRNVAFNQLYRLGITAAQIEECVKGPEEIHRVQKPNGGWFACEHGLLFGGTFIRFSVSKDGPSLVADGG